MKEYLSVVIPAFNAEKTIKHCLEGLEKQNISRDKFEVIVVDDGSTDKTKEEVLKFPGVKYFYQERKGPGAARNLGIQNAQGEVIVFIDADCVPQENWLEEMSKPFSHPEVMGVKGRYQTKQKGIIARLTQVEFEERYQKLSQAKFTDFVDTHSAAFRKEALSRVGNFNPKLINSEDVELSFRLAKEGYKMVFNSQAIIYHQHPSSLAKYIRAKLWRAFWRMEVYKKFPQKIFKDTYTPQTLKFQVLLFYGILLSAVLSLIIPPALYVLWGFLGLFFISTLPLTFLGFKKDSGVAILMPFFVFLRAAALGSGIFYYFVEIKNVKELIIFFLLSTLLITASILGGGRDVAARVIFLIFTFPLAYFTLKLPTNSEGGFKRAELVKIPTKYNIFFPFLGFLAIILILNISSQSIYDSLYEFIHWLGYFIIFWVTFKFINSSDKARRLSYLVIFLAVILSLIGLYFFIQTQHFGYLRLISTFYQHNPFAGFLLLVLPLSLTCFLSRKERKLTLLFGGAAVILFISFILTFSRGAWLSFLIPFVIFLFFIFKEKSKEILKKFLILAVLVTVLFFGFRFLKSYQAGEIETQTTYSQETTEENALTARLNFFTGALNIFREEPVLGTGFNTFSLAYARHLQDVRYYSIDPHNIYLKYLSELGIFGFLTFVWLVITILIIIFKSWYNFNLQSKKQVLSLGLSLGLLGHLIHNAVELDWQFPANLLLFWIILGIFYKIYLLGQLEKQKIVQGERSKEKLVKIAKPILLSISFILLVSGVFLFISEYHGERARSLENQGKIQEAKPAYEQALLYNPFNDNYQRSLGIINYLLGNQDEASRRTQKAITLSWAEAENHHLLALVNEKKEEIEAAKKELILAIKLSPINNLKSYLALSSIYLKERKYEEIVNLTKGLVEAYPLEYFSASIWINPQKEEIKKELSNLYNMRGISYAEKKEKELAQDNFEEALKYWPENPFVQKNLEKIKDLINND